MKNNNTAVIKYIMVRDIEKEEYIPIKVSVTTNQKGKTKLLYSSIINPKQDISKLQGIPQYLDITILQQAPTLYTVSQYIKEIAENYNLEGDEMVLSL